LVHLLRAYAAELALALTRLLGWYLHAVAAADRALGYGDRRGVPDRRYRPAVAPAFAISVRGWPRPATRMVRAGPWSRRGVSTPRPAWP
jgi:hypothetical protein